MGVNFSNRTANHESPFGEDPIASAKIEIVLKSGGSITYELGQGGGIELVEEITGWAYRFNDQNRSMPVPARWYYMRAPCLEVIIKE